MDQVEENLQIKVEKDGWECQQVKQVDQMDKRQDLQRYQQGHLQTLQNWQEEQHLNEKDQYHCYYWKGHDLEKQKHGNQNGQLMWENQKKEAGG